MSRGPRGAAQRPRPARNAGWLAAERDARRATTDAERAAYWAAKTLAPARRKGESALEYKRRVALARKQALAAFSGNRRAA